MSRKARDRRAQTRRDDRYVEGRAKPEDFDAAAFGWNKARSRGLKKFERQEGNLLFPDTQTYYRWLVFGEWKPLVKGRRS